MERGWGRGQPRSKAIMTPLFRRLQPRQKFRITISALAKHAVRLIAQLLKIPKHLIVRIVCEAWCEAAYAGHTSSLSTATIKADNSSVTANCSSGKTPLPVRFKIAPPGNNYAHYGLPLKQTSKSTKTSMTTVINRFCAKSGHNAGLHPGRSKS